MFESLRAGWKLSSAVRKQVFKDKALLSYMVLSAVVILLEAAVIFGSFIFAYAPSIAASANVASASTSPVITLAFIGALLLFYVASSFTSAYVLLALFIAFRSYAAGNKISLSSALVQARGYSKLLLEWALFYSIIILVLRILESRLRGIGAAVVGILAGVALSIGVMFALPVIYEKRVGPIKAMKASATTFVEHFGSSVGGIAYSDLYGLLFILIGILAFIISLSLSAGLAGSANANAGFAAILPLIVGFFVMIIFIVLGATIASTTSNIFKLLLYDYASGKGLPEWIDENLVIKAVRYKKGQSPPASSSL